MKEYYIFRFYWKYIENIFDKNEGKIIDEDIREITIATDDIKIQQLYNIKRRLKNNNELLFSVFDSKRKYNKKEIRDAKLFQLKVNKYFEPFGEECGTIYDESKECAYCGSGRVQISKLHLDLRKISIKIDVQCTYADEIVISEKFSNILLENNITGIELKDVAHKANYLSDAKKLNRYPSGKEIIEKYKKKNLPLFDGGFYIWLNEPDQQELLEQVEIEYAVEQERKNKLKVFPIFKQFIVNSPTVKIVPPTKVGIDPFNADENGEYKCPLGHTLGLNLLSEVYANKNDYNGEDVIKTTQMIGDKRGMLRPYPIILVSPKFRQVVIDNNIKGLSFDVVHLV